MAQIHETTFVAFPSPLTLSVALNTAYFTFRAANKPGFDQIEREFKEASILRNSDVLLHHDTLQRQFQTLHAQHSNFVNRYTHLYNGIDNFMLWVGYAIAFISLALLVITSIRPDDHINYVRVIIIFFLLYSPVSLCILAELVISVSRSKRSKAIEVFVRECGAIIRASRMAR